MEYADIRCTALYAYAVVQAEDSVAGSDEDAYESRSWDVEELDVLRHVRRRVPV